MPREIPVGDVILVWESGYDGTVSDFTDPQLDRKRGFSRICRGLDELLALCPAAGIEYGTDIPAYSNEWFEDNAVIVLAFTEGARSEEWVHGNLPNVDLAGVFVDGDTARVDLRRIDNVFLFISTRYTVLIEVEAAYLEGVETVEPPVVRDRSGGEPAS
ncbi:MAG: hypothetical protein FWG72_00380 [Oscillospiraceae bacterium]|nr:hypothetical protein [Oscillospiraceae bacterium]